MYTWRASVSDLEVFADFWTRIFTEDAMTHGHLTALPVIA